MIGIGSNKKIIDLYNDIKSGVLKLQPEFQRRLVWNEEHKDNFIDTILRGLPFPEIYTAVGEIDLVNRKTQVVVVDGQQRLSTIYEYIEGSDKFDYSKIKRFCELNENEQRNFFYYVVVVRDLGHIPLVEIKDIFRRINSVGYALEAIEINNALYDGEYIRTAKKIKDDFNLYSTFKENEISRMKDLEFILAIMVTNDLQGYFTGYKEVEIFVQNYNDRYPDKEKTLSNFSKLSEILERLSLPEDSIWINSRSCFFTLTVEILKVIDKINIEMTKDLSEILNVLNNNIMENKDFQKEDINKYAKFYKAMYQGTGSKKNRTIRGEILENELQKLVIK